MLCLGHSGCPVMGGRGRESVNGRERRKEGRKNGKVDGYIDGCMDGRGGEEERKGEFSGGSLRSRRSGESKLGLDVGRGCSVGPE